MDPGCVKEVGSKAKDLGAKKRLIVTDQGLNKAGVPDIIIKHLSEQGIDSHVFAGAEPNQLTKMSTMASQRIRITAVILSSHWWWFVT